jgi:hypothetical protein
MSDKSNGAISLGNNAIQTVVLGGAVTFNVLNKKVGRDFKTFLGSGSIIARKSMTIAYDFSITPAVPAVNVMCLAVNGVVVPNTLSVGSGFGLLDVKRGDLLTCQLDAGSPGGPVLLDSGPIANAASASLTLTRYKS